MTAVWQCVSLHLDNCIQGIRGTVSRTKHIQLIVISAISIDDGAWRRPRLLINLEALLKRKLCGDEIDARRLLPRQPKHTQVTRPLSSSGLKLVRPRGANRGGSVPWPLMGHLQTKVTAMPALDGRPAHGALEGNTFVLTPPYDPRAGPTATLTLDCKLVS